MHKDYGNMHFLIIEDNTGDFYLIKDFLEEEFNNIHIAHVTTFEEAKELLVKNTNFNVILLDLSLPDCSGEELVTHVIELAPAIPVIVLTGFSDRDFSVKTLSMGVSDYLLKDELSVIQLSKSIHYSIERKKNHHKLKESEEKYRHLFNFSPMPMWVYEVKTLKFLSVNDSAIKHYGYSREEFLNMDLRGIRPEEDIPVLEKAVLEKAVSESSDKNIYSKGLYRHRMKNGQIFEVEIQSNAIIYEGKQCRLVLATDVSDRMEYIRAIEDQNNVMREIAWIQSHVVRAPVARIMGLIDILTGSIKTEERSKVIGYIVNSAKELDNIVRDIVRKTENVEKSINGK